MSFSTWMPPVVSSESRDWRGSIWRMVEAQHIASTMKIVDDSAEQDILESLLETSKPLLPKEVGQLDYLLAAPFRYVPLRPGSRFRSVTDPGVFYGAATVHAACAELGYWRWKFLKDAIDLDKLEPVAHTAFQAQIAALALDLREPPLNKDAALWMHPTDYTATQALAREAREANAGAIIYQSVRDPESGWCMAVLTPNAFSSNKPNPLMQTWWIAVHQEEVIWRRDHESMIFVVSNWV